MAVASSDLFGYLWWNRAPRSPWELLNQAGLHALIPVSAAFSIGLSWYVVVMLALPPLSIRLWYGMRYLRAHPEVHVEYAQERRAQVRDFDEGFGG